MQAMNFRRSTFISKMEKETLDLDLFFRNFTTIKVEMVFLGLNMRN